MPAPLYARYVPPKSTGRSKLPTEVPIEKNGEKSTITSTPQLYNRYIPSKSSKHTVAPVYSTPQPLNASKIEHPSPTSDSDDRTPSRKRKRTKERNAHADGEPLVTEHPSAKHNGVDRSNGESGELIEKKDHKSKKQKHKTRKLEAFQPRQQEPNITGKQVESEDERDVHPEIADSILAKYSVTGGAHRELLMVSRNLEPAPELKNKRDIDLEKETDNSDVQLNMDSSDGNLNNGDPEEEEEMTKAGVEAIFQKYRRTAELAGAKKARNKPDPDAGGPGAAAEELELHGNT
jgi:hypothetical protein